MVKFWKTANQGTLLITPHEFNKAHIVLMWVRYAIQPVQTAFFIGDITIKTGGNVYDVGHIFSEK